VFAGTGAVVDGPPLDPLVTIATKVDGDRVMVHA
jgi:Rieske Fe-S protein